MPTPFQVTRRQTFAVLVGGALTAARAAGTADRAVVCIRLGDPNDAAGMTSLSASADLAFSGGINLTSSASGERFALHPSLPPLDALFQSRSVAFLDEATAGTPDWDYVAGGFTAPRWMMQAAQVDVTNSGNRAFTFSSGLLALLPKGGPIGGNQDNPSLVTAAQTGGFAFPASSLGQQLRQIAGLLASGEGAGGLFVASLSGGSGASDAAGLRAARLTLLAEALAAFQTALDRSGTRATTATFTDSMQSSLANGRTSRLLLGGHVLGSELYHSDNAASTYAALAGWSGYQADPAFSSSAPRFLY